MSAPLFPHLSLDEACDALVAGKLIAFPTETFYGLGCNAMNADAVGAVFSLKKRSLAMPLPVVISSTDMLDDLVINVSETTRSLIETFWPGPLSILLPARPEVPDLLTANAHKIAVRFSPHPAVLELCRATGRVLVASSANISGRPPAARFADLDPELSRGIEGVYNAGPEPAGESPSTVLEVREKQGRGTVCILRPGAISEHDLRSAGFTVQETVNPIVP